MAAATDVIIIGAGAAGLGAAKALAGEALGGSLVQTCAGARLSGEAVALKVGEALSIGEIS